MLGYGVIQFTLAFSIFFWSVFAQALCVKSSSANLRSGPGTRNPITWTAPLYTPLIELSRSGGWIQVEDMDGDTHWVSAINVTSRIVCVSVKVAVAKLRKGPGSKGPVADIRQVDRYTPFKRTDIDEAWFEVVSGWGETYWIHENTVWRPVRISKVSF